MLKTLIYILGALALHHTDFTHPNAFYHFFLPLVDILFLIFLVWQLIFFFALNNFSDGKHHGFYDLLADIYDLRYDIQEQGLLSALFYLSLNLLEAICLFISLFYYGNLTLLLISS